MKAIRTYSAGFLGLSPHGRRSWKSDQGARPALLSSPLQAHSTEIGSPSVDGWWVRLGCQ